MKTIGIIGAGNIGTAIARGFVNKGKYSPGQIQLSRKNTSLLSELGKEGYVIKDNKKLAAECDVIILAVLPGQVREVLGEIKPELSQGAKILVSVVSVVSIQELTSWGGIEEVVRVMPNTAAEFGLGMTCLAGEYEALVKEVESLFAPLGETMIIKEQLMPAATIMGACGIAFFLRVIRALTQGGIQIGFHADEAGKIAAQTAMGAAVLLMKTGHHPETEIDKVTTPMGVTIAGLNEMEHYGLSSAMIKGIVKSYSGISKAE